MRHRILTRLVVGLALTAAVASVNCGGDDTTPAGTGAGGTGGGSGGATGTGGSAGTGGSVGSGGTVGTGGTGGVGTGGTADSGSGGGGTGGVRDAGPESDAPAPGTFAAVQAILQQRCQGCHTAARFPARIDLNNVTDDAGASLYARLTSPLPNNQEGQCGFTLGQEGGADGGDAEAGAEAGDGGDGGGIVDAPARANRIPIVANSLALSYLYQKINGTHEAKDINPPLGCGARMPRVLLPGPIPDGGDAGDGGDAAVPPVLGPGCDLAAGDGSLAGCLSPAQIAGVAAWINAGALNN